MKALTIQAFNTTEYKYMYNLVDISYRLNDILPMYKLKTSVVAYSPELTSI